MRTYRRKILTLSLCLLFAFLAPPVGAAAKGASGTSSQKTSTLTVKSKKADKKISETAKSQKAAASKMPVKKQRIAYHKRSNKKIVHTPPPSFATRNGLRNAADPLSLASSAAIVVDPVTYQILFEKNANISLPIASITKLMTALVVIESMQDLKEMIVITEEDAVLSNAKGRSRLRVGMSLTRGELLHLALMNSENRASIALGRSFPGGTAAFVKEMNLKSRVLGMKHTRFVDTSGLSSQNVSSAMDLSRLVMAASHYPILRQYSTDKEFAVNDGNRLLQYGTTNRLVHNPEWEIELQKTGYIAEAGRCLVMQAIISDQPFVIVLLDSLGNQSRAGDAQRIKNWLVRNYDVDETPSIKTPVLDVPFAKVPRPGPAYHGSKNDVDGLASAKISIPQARESLLKPADNSQTKKQM